MWVLPKREATLLLEEMGKKWPAQIGEENIKNIKAVEVDEHARILISEGFTAVQIDSEILPFLGDEKSITRFPKVIVDPGAIRYICNGASVMRPGIVAFEGSFDRGDIVAVREQSHGKFIAVGKASVDFGEAQGLEKGVVVKNLHYVGDKIWETGNSIE